MQSTVEHTNPTATRVEPCNAVHAWEQPHFTRWGHDPRDSYAETFWLPALGPTAYTFGRRIALLHEAFNTTALPDTIVEHSQALGVMPSVLQSTIKRLHRFGLATTHPDGFYAVRTKWPDLKSTLVRQLSTQTQRVHRHMMAQFHEMNPLEAQLRVFWNDALRAHELEVTPEGLAIELRRLQCPDWLADELVTWMKDTPRPVRY